jgi:hypothetical protein
MRWNFDPGRKIFYGDGDQETDELEERNILGIHVTSE